MSLLRGVVVTNHGSATEAVVLAVEAWPWHQTSEESEACTGELCKKCHRIYVLDTMVFDFEKRKVYPVGNPDYGVGSRTGMIGPIPAGDLAKFKADFGLYYSS